MLSTSNKLVIKPGIQNPIIYTWDGKSSIFYRMSEQLHALGYVPVSI